MTSPLRPDSTGRVPHLIFESGEQVSGSDPCNLVRGTYRLDGAQLRFDDLLIDQEGLRRLVGRREQQAAYHRALGGYGLDAARRPDPDAARLLRRPLLMVFRAADAPSPAAATSVLIRIRNDAAIDFDRVQASFPFGPEIDYGPLPDGRDQRV